MTLAEKMSVRPQGPVYAGTPSTWHRKRVRVLFDRNRGNTNATASVPCGSCTACCESGYQVQVEDHEAAGLDTELARDGVRVVRRRADGACIHFVDGACSVYDKRPSRCRIYDCREMFFTGVLPAGKPKLFEAVCRWRTSYKTRQDHELTLAMRLAAMKEMQADAGKFIAEDVSAKGVLFAQAWLPTARRLCRRFDAMPKAEKDELATMLQGLVEVGGEDGS